MLAPFHPDRPYARVTTPAALASCPEADLRRLPDACPHAAEVRTLHDWLAAGRVVTKGQKGIRLGAPDTIDDTGKLRSITPDYVTQTQALARRPAA